MLSFAVAFAVGLLGTAATPPPATADISVDFESPRSLVFGGARFEVSITNHGPDPLTSATVVVQFGVNSGTGWPTPCAFDSTASTLTCTFGALPVGGTATLSTSHPIYLAVSGPPFRFSNTATRTASTPSDPNSTNDIDTDDCSFMGSVFPPSPVPTLYC